MENKENKGIKKININDSIKLNDFRNLPTEALNLLGNIIDKQELNINTKKVDEKKENLNDKINISVKIPPPPPPPPTSSNKVSLPPPPPPTIDRKEDIIIDENGNLFGLSLGKSSKSDVINVMKNKSKEVISNLKNNVFKYEDIGISFYFSSFGILEEISFYYPFKGKTIKGLSLNDDINKAIKLYGEPKIRTLEGAIWSQISVFLEDDIVTSIRIRK